MARRQWTLMVLADDQSRVRQYRISSRAVRSWLAVASVALLVLVTLAAGFFMEEPQRFHAERLTKANELLTHQLETLRSDMAVLQNSLAELSAKDERYRLLANLQPLDEDVKKAGVGGPGTRTLEETPLWHVDRKLAREAFGASEDVNALIRRARVLTASWDEATRSMETQVDAWERTPSIMPTEGYESSGFSRSRMHPILNIRRPHKGIDIVARRGTPVVAAAKGTVVFAADTHGEYGWMVDVDHGNGVTTRYAHLAKGSVVVKPGQLVERWQKLAEVGSTGLVTAPSTHYEVIVDGRPVDPDKFVLGDVLRF